MRVNSQWQTTECVHHLKLPVWVGTEVCVCVGGGGSEKNKKDVVFTWITRSYDSIKHLINHAHNNFVRRQILHHTQTAAAFHPISLFHQFILHVWEILSINYMKNTAFAVHNSWLCIAMCIPSKMCFIKHLMTAHLALNNSTLNQLEL